MHNDLGWCLGLLLALIGTHWYAYSAGVSREHDRNTAAASVQKDAVAGQVDSQAQASAQARTNMLDYLGRIPAIEVRTNEAAERVRIIYRDSPTVRIAARPARVQSEIDAAYRAAVTATGAVRQPITGSPANGP
jgi:hypothetical protein